MAPTHPLLAFLHSPQLVAKFQRYFGVTINCLSRQSQPPLSIDSSSYSNGNTSNYKDHYNLRKRRVDESDLSDGSSVGDFSKQSSQNNSQQEIEYSVGNWFWYYLFRFAASLGYEIFYATFFPIWFWNVDGAVGRRFILLWAIIMYTGQALKDVIKWPRPTCPPVVLMEPEYAMEYGMPSTHAMVGFSLPFSIVIFTANRYDYPLWIGVLIAGIWCILVCGSRLYLGMHSLLDIVAGLLLAGSMMAILLPVIDWLDHLHLTSRYSPIFLFTGLIGMALFYPKSERWSPARGDTNVIIGAGAGILFGSWLNYQLGIVKGPAGEPPFPIIWPGFDVAILAILRAVIGIVCMGGARFFGKTIGLRLPCYLRGLDVNDAEVRKRASVEVPFKLVTYVSVGITITFLSPCVFRRLNIERETMFTEV